MTEINTSFDVYVLGDVDTSKSLDMLTEKAAEHGAVIVQTFAFAEGEVLDSEGKVVATATGSLLIFPLQER